MKLPEYVPYSQESLTDREKQIRDTVVRDCAERCERRAESLREGAAVARQCKQDILAGYGLEPRHE